MNDHERQLAEDIIRQIVGMYIWEQCYNDTMNRELVQRLAHWAEGLMREVCLTLSDRPEREAAQRIEALVCTFEMAGIPCGRRHFYF